MRTTSGLVRPAASTASAPSAASAVTSMLGIDLGFAMTGARSVEITRTYVAAFCTGKPQPLLDKPSARHPEVTFGG
ncbi:hypothetical protein [Nonomuraea monospora]